MPVHSNTDQIISLIQQIASTVDFTRPGADGSLADDCLDLIVEGISDRSRAASDPTGAEWAANRGKYGEKKRGAGVPVGIGYRRRRPQGEMLSLQELKGQRAIAPHKASMTFGTAEFVRKRGEWFTHGSIAGADGGEASGAPNQPPRPFYVYTPEDEKKVMEHLERFVQEELDKL